MRVFTLSADILLKKLIRAGVQLRLVGEKLQVKGNGELDPGIREEIKANRSGLIDLVRAGEHLWRPVAEWQFWRDGDWMIGKRLDAPGETSWPIEPIPEDKVASLP